MNLAPIAAAALIAACSTSASAQLVNASTRLSRLRLTQAEHNAVLQQHTFTSHENEMTRNHRQRKLIFHPNAESNQDEGKDETAAGPEHLVATMEVGLMSSLSSIGSSLSLSMSMAQEISSPEYSAWNNINDEIIAGTMAASLSMETEPSMSLPMLEYPTENDADPDYTNWNGNEDVFSLSMTESFSLSMSLPMDFVNEENSISMSLNLNAQLPDDDTSIASPNYPEWSTEESDVDYDLEFSLSQSMSMPTSMLINDVVIESPTFSPTKRGRRSKSGKRPNEDPGLIDDDLIVIPNYPAWNVIDEESMSLVTFSSMSVSIFSTPSTESEGVEDEDIIGTPNYSWNDETLSLPLGMSFPVSMSMDNAILESPTYSPTKRGPRSKAGKRPIEDSGLTHDEFTGIPNYPAWNTDEGSTSLPLLVSMSMSNSMSMMITIPSIEMSMPGIESESTEADTMIDIPNYSWIDEKLSTPTEATSKPLTMELYDEGILVLGGSGSTPTTTTPVSSTASSTEPPKTKAGKEPSEPYVSNDFDLFDVNLEIGNAKATKNIPSRRRLLENDVDGRSLQEIDTKAAKDILGAIPNTPESPKESNASNDSPEQEFGKLAPDEAGVFSMSMFSMDMNPEEEPSLVQNSAEVLFAKSTKRRRLLESEFDDNGFITESDDAKAGKEPPGNSDDPVQEFGNLISDEATSMSMSMILMPMNEAGPPLVQSSVEFAMGKSTKRRRLFEDEFGIHRSLGESDDSKAAKESPNESNESNDSPEQEFGNLVSDESVSLSMSMFSNALHFAEPSLAQNSVEFFSAKSLKRRRLTEYEGLGRRALVGSKSDKESPDKSDPSVKPEQEFGNLIFDQSFSLSMSVPGSDNSLVDFTLQEDLNDDDGIIVIGGPVPNPSINVPPLEQTDFDIYLVDSLPTKIPTTMKSKVVAPLDEDPPSLADDSDMFRNFPTLVPTPMNSEIVIASPSKDLLVERDDFDTIGDIIPTYMPTSEPTFETSSKPSTSPTHWPTSYPTSDPTYIPSYTPTSELTSADTFLSPTNYPSTSSTELNSKSAKAEESFEEKNNDEEIASKTLKDDSNSKAGKRQL